jgi:hypothetical protein
MKVAYAMRFRYSSGGVPIFEGETFTYESKRLQEKQSLCHSVKGIKRRLSGIL